MTSNNIKRRSGFSSIPNACMSDRNLSIDSRGLLGLLMTQSQDWKFYRNDIIERCNCGPDKYDRMRKELIRFGYLKIYPKRDDLTGRISGHIWEIIDEPYSIKADDLSSTFCPDQITGNPDSGKPKHISINNNKNLKDKNISYTKSKNLELNLGESNEVKTTKKLYSDEFIEMWKKYSIPLPSDRRSAYKPQAYKKYQKIIKGDSTNDNIPVSEEDLIFAIAGYYKSEYKKTGNYEYCTGIFKFLNRGTYIAYLPSNMKDERSSRPSGGLRVPPKALVESYALKGHGWDEDLFGPSPDKQNTNVPEDLVKRYWEVVQN